MALLVDSLALLGLRGRRLDARFGARCGFLGLDLEGFLASRFALFTFGNIALLNATRTEPIDGTPKTGTETIDHGEPRDSKRQREPRHRHGECEQRAADEVEVTLHPLADETADDATGTLPKDARGEMQCGESAGGREQQYEPAETYEGVES